MTIICKRIINPQRYLYALHPGDKFYIAVPLAEEDYPRLQFYGLLPDSPKMDFRTTAPAPFATHCPILATVAV